MHSQGSRIKRHQVVLFSTVFSSASLIKAKKSDRPYLFTGMKSLTTFYILLSREDL